MRIYKLIPPIGIPLTTEPAGITNWHLLAAKMLSWYDTVEFVKRANNESSNTLLDDLSESCRTWDATWETHFVAHCPLYEESWTWEQFVNQAAYRTPLELCEIVGQPLLVHPSVATKMTVHEVIQAAQAASVEKLEWRPNC